MYTILKESKTIKTSDSLKLMKHEQPIKYIGFVMKRQRIQKIIAYNPNFEYCFCLSKKEYESLVFDEKPNVIDKFPYCSIGPEFAVENLKDFMRVFK